MWEAYVAICTHLQNLNSADFGLLHRKLAEREAKFKVQLNVCGIFVLQYIIILAIRVWPIVILANGCRCKCM